MRKGMLSLVAVLALVMLGSSAVWAHNMAGPRPLVAPGTGVAIVDADPNSQKWGYVPADVTVTAGSTVIWHNDGQQPHTVTANDLSFDSPIMGPGADWQWTFAAPGEFSYFCKPHPWMKGIVRVVH